MPGPYPRPTESEPLVVVLSGNHVESEYHRSRSKVALRSGAGRCFTSKLMDINMFTYNNIVIMTVRVFI